MKIAPASYRLTPADSDEVRALVSAISGAIDGGHGPEGELAEVREDLRHVGAVEVSREALDAIETALMVFEESASESTEWADRHEYTVLNQLRQSITLALKERAS